MVQLPSKTEGGHPNMLYGTPHSLENKKIMEKAYHHHLLTYMIIIEINIFAIFKELSLLFKTGWLLRNQTVLVCQVFTVLFFEFLSMNIEKHLLSALKSLIELFL
jgi:hypothetical protein